MSKENRMKIVLSLLGISFPVVGGILSVYVEDCGVLLLIGGIAGMTFCLARAFEVKKFCKDFWLALLFAFVLCPPIFFWLNPHAFKEQESPSSLYVHTNAKMIVDTHTLVSNNWDVFIAKYISNRAWATGMFMEEDIRTIIAESRQRERKNLWAKKRKNDGNGGSTSSRKLWWLALMMFGMTGGIDTMVKEWWKKRCAAGNRPFNKWIYNMLRFILCFCCLLVCSALAWDSFRLIEAAGKRHTEYERVKKLLEEADFSVDEKTWNKNEVNHDEEISR